eukprot:1724728-Pleurochrysis_carterae.AAC.5
MRVRVRRRRNSPRHQPSRALLPPSVLKAWKNPTTREKIPIEQRKCRSEETKQPSTSSASKKEGKISRCLEAERKCLGNGQGR